MIRIIAKSTVGTDKMQDFLRIAEELIIETIKEDGCISYELCQDNNDEHVFYFIEFWKNSNYFRTHMNSSHFKKLFPLIESIREDNLDAIMATKVL